MKKKKGMGSMERGHGGAFGIGSEFVCFFFFLSFPLCSCFLPHPSMGPWITEDEATEKKERPLASMVTLDSSVCVH